MILIHSNMVKSEQMNFRNRPYVPSALAVAAALASTFFGGVAPVPSSAVAPHKTTLNPSQPSPSNNQSPQTPFSFSVFNAPVFSEEKNWDIEDDVPDDVPHPICFIILLCIWTDTRTFEPDPVHKPPWNSLVV